ncbi:AAA family ATPase [Pluralibacter gergoviae]|uniref:AAA family ATPase n=1 Tax=Pluralibacter gergoviae TaxID=61647 RepID=UPI000A3A3513
MIVGVILRNFKNFRNQHYIPLTVNARSSWLIGENGVGKSSILQALDTILNKNDFNKLDINNDARSQGLLTREPSVSYTHLDVYKRQAQYFKHWIQFLIKMTLIN